MMNDRVCRKHVTGTLIQIQSVAGGIICAFALGLLPGCDSASVTVRGTVTLDDNPLEEGQITLTPQPGTSGPTAGGKIQNGQFTIKSDAGIVAGAYRVEITASRKSGQQTPDQLGRLVDVYEQYIPARYNEQSELTEELTTASNELAYELRSD